MPDLKDGEEATVQGSGSSSYTLKRDGDIYSCTCPAWQYQGAAIDQRTCKHLKKYRGEDAENARVGASLTASSSSSSSSSSSAPPVLLAHKWENDRDPSGWWISEKLDGVRAYWDGTTLMSRLGNAFSAPDWFLDRLPKEPLDGELFIDRGQFQRTVSVVRSGGRGEGWKEVRFEVFDLPAHKGEFEERLDEMKALLDGIEGVRALPHIECKDMDHLKEELARVEDLGGEGLMLRQPKSKYVAGRSSTLLKVKNFYDAEARVRGHVAGKGKHKGRLGALEVELKDGTIFNVGSGFSDRQRGTPPDVGAIITFRYQELTNAGVPRFPTFVGTRDDVTWATMSPLPNKVKATSSRAPAKTPTSPARAFAPGKGDDRTRAATGEDLERWGNYLVVRSGDDEKILTFDDAASARDALQERAAVAPVQTGSAVPDPVDDDDNLQAGDGDERVHLSLGGNKFWEIERFGSALVFRWGALPEDARAKRKVKRYADDDEAKDEHVRQVRNKKARGYVE